MAYKYRFVLNNILSGDYCFSYMLHISVQSHRWRND